MGAVEVNGYTIEPEADLSGADLAGADLAGARLGRANLEGANLEGVNLSAAKLKEVKLICDFKKPPSGGGRFRGGSAAFLRIVR